MRARVLNGGVAVLGADVYSNLLRLGSNLIFTRLLYPEAFGLMLIVNLFFTAFSMLSDVGVRGAIITRKEPIDTEYLNTAWTIMVLRGVFISALGAALAYPISLAYSEPSLIGLILLASLGPLVQGFTSPAPMLYEKDVRLGRVMVWGAVSQTITTGVSIGLVYIWPTVWVLALNGVVSGLVSVATSYAMFRANPPHFAWSRSAASEIYVFGRWVFVGTGLTFLARQGDSVIVSKMLTTEVLGVFSIAVTFSKISEMLIERISWALLFPVYAELRHSGPDKFNRELAKVKLGIFGLCGPLIFLLATGGRDLVGLLYDPRYLSAGYMLELLAAGSIFFVAGGALINVPLSFGDSFRHMWLQAIRFGILLFCMLMGGSWFGLGGLLLGIVVAQAIFYPVVVYMAFIFGVRGFLHDVWFIVLLGIPILAVWLHRGFPFSFLE